MEAGIVVATAGRPWSFDADGADFKLATEAYRINLAHLFDPIMAVHTSNVEPLPHQITAVYESMLPKQPLRYVLADDPGAGKTIMAGRLIRELLMRVDAARVLIVSPGTRRAALTETSFTQGDHWQLSERKHRHAGQRDPAADLARRSAPVRHPHFPARLRLGWQ